MDLHELSEIAYQAERHHFGVAGGWQDQYATFLVDLTLWNFSEQILLILFMFSLMLFSNSEEKVDYAIPTSHDSGLIHSVQRNHPSKSDINNLSILMSS